MHPLAFRRKAKNNIFQIFVTANLGLNFSFVLVEASCFANLFALFIVESNLRRVL